MYIARNKSGNRGAAVKHGLLASLLALALFGLLAPFSSFAAECDVFDPSPGGCKSNCMKSGVYCSLLDAPAPPGWSWNSSNTNLCAPEAARPANPPNGSYNTVNCNNNTWTLTCSPTYTACGNTTCVSNITIPFCTTVNQCTARCSACNGGYTTCDAGLSCEANITLPNCAVVNQCTDLCTTCNTGYELVGGYCVGTTLKLSKNSVKANKDLTNSSEPAVVYVTSDGLVGISTGNPQYMVHIASGAGETGTILAVSTGSTNLFWVDGAGAHATKFFVDGGDLQNLNASNLASGTVPLARLYGITKDQIAPDAGIYDTQLSSIATPGKVFDSALSPNVSLLDANQTLTGLKTFVSSVTVAGVLGAPRLELADNVAISSEALADLGAGVTISSNVYIIGFASATRYYGDGSFLTMGGSGSGLDADTLDTLDSADFVRRTNDINEQITGAKLFSSSMAVLGGITTPRVEFSGNVAVSSETSADLGGGVTISSNVYIVGFASATKYYGDGSELVMGGSGSGLDADTLDTLDSLDFVNRTGDISEYINGAKTFTSSVTVTAALGAPRFELADNVSISSEPLADLGGGVTISSNVYIIGFASATGFFGDGSRLTGLGSANDANYLDGLDSLDYVRRTGDVGEDITGAKTFTSSVTVTAALGAPRFELADNVAISSETLADLGGGVTISSNVYIIGFASATKYYGDGSALVMGGSGSGLDADTLDTLDSLDFVNRTGNINEEVAGAKTFTSSMTVTAAVGALRAELIEALLSPRVDLAPEVAISSEALADLGGGVRISSNVYIVGFASATQYFGDGSQLTGLASSLYAENANLLDTLDSSDFVRRTNDINEQITGDKLFSSSITVMGGLSTPRVSFDGNISISSEALADVGGGISISTNVYIVGFASATKYYGDGSALVMGGSGSGLDADTLDTLDSLDFVNRTGDISEYVTGAKTFTSSMTVTTALGAPRFELAEGVAVSSEALADLGGGVAISSNVYIVGFASAAKYYGEGSELTYLNASSLASGTVPLARLSGITTLEIAPDAWIADTQLSTISTPGKVFDTALSANVSLLDGSQVATGIKTFTSSMTVTAALGAPRLELADYVAISSEASADLGAGVTISSNVYIIGFASATKYYGDGSALVMGGAGSGLDADLLDTLDSLDFVNRTGNRNEEVTGAKTFVSSMTVTTALGAPRFELAEGVAVSSEALADLGGGLRISSNVYVVGFASAAKYYGEGSELTYLNASNLASGIVPLERLLGLTSSQIAADAGLDDMQLSTISTPGKVFDSALSANVSLLDGNQTASGIKTFTSSMTVTAALGAPRLELAGNVAVAYEPQPELGGGVTVSSNVYIIGFASATKYYGDGSSLTMGGTGSGLDADKLDNLDSSDFVRRTGDVNEAVTGFKTFTSSVTVTAALGALRADLTEGAAAPRLDLAANISISSETLADLGGGVSISSNVYIIGFASATRFFGDGSNLTGLGSANDANYLDGLDSLDYVRRTGDVSEEITGAKTFTSSVTVTSSLGAPRVELAANVAISSETSADLGAGVTISSNVYIVGFASATKYYGDGSSLVLGGSGSGLDADTLDTLDSLDFVNRTGNISEEVTGAKTFVSSVTITTALGAPRLELAGNIAISSETLADVGGGVTVSSNVYIIGFASATKYYGDGSALVMGGAGSGLDADTLDTLDSLDFVNRTDNINEEITGAKTFVSSVTVTSVLGALRADLSIALGAPRLELAGNVAISSETLADLGGGVTISSNVYIIGFASATGFYGDGSRLTGLGSANDANYLDGLDSLDYVRRTGDVGEEITGAKTFTSSATVTTALGAPRVELAANVAISSETSADLGAGVTISSNVYIIGFASATKYYGDGSALVMGGAGSGLDADTLDTLDSVDFVNRTGNLSEYVSGAKTFTSSVTVTSALGAPRLELAGNVAISSETLADLGGGVTISSNVYIIGFASATGFYGDGSQLTGLGSANDANYLDGLDSLDYVRRTGDVGEEITGAKTFTSSVTVTSVLGAPRLELAGNVTISSETLADLGGGVTISSNVYIIGFASATRYYGDGSFLTMGGSGSGLDADTLDTLDSLDFVNRTDNINEEITGSKTFLSSVTVTSALGAPRLELGDNVFISSEPLADLGGGVTISSNVYIIGFASATGFYGDGSRLTGLGSANDANYLDGLDSLDYVRRTGDVGEEITGAKTFTSSVTVTSALGAPRLELAENVTISSETLADLGGGVTISSNVYIIGFASATRFFGDGSELTGLGSANNANYLDSLDSLDFVRRTGGVSEEITGAKTFTSSVTVTSALGAPRLELAGNVAISSETLADLGAGVTISSNVYIIGFASATMYYGNGSKLTGIGGAGSSLDADTLDGLDSLAFVRSSGDVSEVITGAKTFTSSMTVTAALGTPRLELGDNVFISSEPLADLGGGVRVSSNVYIVGFASAARFYGDGAGLTALDASSLASGIVPLERLLGLTSSQLSADAGIDDMQLSTISTPGKVFDSALSANVSLLSATQTVTGARIFTSSVAMTLALSVPRIELSSNVVISSEASAALGAGVHISSNVQIDGFASAVKFYGDGSGLTGLVATAQWVGKSGTAKQGNNSGYTTANVECSTAYADSHVCNTTEILFSINSGIFGTFPVSEPLWFSNGPPGYTWNANDCIGWTSSGASDYGAIWTKAAAGTDGYGSIQPCNGTARKFACCK